MKLLGRDIGLDQPLFLIAGPCVIESEELQLRTAETLKAITDKLGILFIFKSSFDKANRSQRPELSRARHGRRAAKCCEKVRDALGVPILTDVHDIPQVEPVAEVVDVLQTPAFLARQTDFIHAVASARQAGQHQEGAVHGAARHGQCRRQGARRGQAGGRRRRQHHGVRARRHRSATTISCQRHAQPGDHARNRLPGGVRRDPFGAVAGRAGDESSGGQREFVPVLARAAVATGVSRPVHGNPSRSRQRHVRRPQRLAARPHGKPADDPGRDRPAVKEAGFEEMTRMRPTVFIQANARQMLGARISRASATRRTASAPDEFRRRNHAMSADFPRLMRPGQSILRGGHVRAWDPDDLQSFTPLRFAPPTLMKFKGRALVTDPDCFGVGDVAELLFDRDMGGKAIMAVPRPGHNKRPRLYRDLGHAARLRAS